MKRFQPIAIVGQGCVLPGALNASELWDLVSSGRDVLRPVDKNYWGASDVTTSVEKPDGDKTWTTVGAYVDGFDSIFDASKYDQDLDGLDEIFLWTLHAATQAYTQAGFEIGQNAHGGLVLGNLSYPTRKMSDYADSVWRGKETGNALNRYMSAFPAFMTGSVLGLTSDSFSLDAACASSLYAMKLACDALNEGRADVMLAGGVNHADDLFLHIGFCALNAMSRTGQSRPFHKDADGLIPAEGVAIVALKRLEEAERDGNEILGVIRAIGVSNDGRGSGMLVPSQNGQVRAMQNAYALSGINPNDLSYVECHATGTPIGDGIELESMAQIFDAEIPVGSMKSNTGHLITASGAAGLMKVLGAFKHGKIPPTIHAEEPLDTLSQTPFRLANTLEDWNVEKKIAAVNNFGFGGNNAHLIVEEYLSEERMSEGQNPLQAEMSVRTGVVALAGFIGDGTLTNPKKGAKTELKFDLRDLKFPPNDLDVTLPQQLAVLETALALKEEIEALPKDRTGVFIGMQTDTEIARYGSRWRNDDGGDGVVKKLNAAGVLGTMPNIVTNRLNTQFDLRGPSFSVSSDDSSGVEALAIASRALHRGEIDAAIVGAVEMGADPVHAAANAGVDLPVSTTDACVLFILRRTEDAAGVELTPEMFEPTEEAIPNVGYAHAAQSGIGTALKLIDAGLKETTRTLADSPTVKTYPAHWSPVRFEKKQRAFSNAQKMVAAPVLPSTHRDVSAWSAPIPVVNARPSVEVVGAATADPVTELFAEVSAMHQQFLEEQTAMHQKFLGLQRAIEDAMNNPGTAGFQPARPSGIVPVQRKPNGVHRKPVREPAPKKVEVLPVARETLADQDVPKFTKDLRHKIIPSHQKTQPVGPTFDYDQIHEHASGKISNVYGPLFAQQDDFPVQVRMPEPPLLLCHRVTGIDCEPGVVGKGTLWCESDIPDDAWFLHANRMPVGIMIESGQADLMLCSWMGADFENKGDRCYRLLGCELMFHGGLAKPGDVLKYDIHIDGHARQNDIRLFFFHYDLEIDNEVRLSVRQGQAGFFTYDELAESNGVIWSPDDLDLDELKQTPFDEHPQVTSKRSFTGEEIKKFSNGLTFDAFGAGFERAAAHSATPKIDNGDMCFMDEVLQFDPNGGPWGRGYLKAVQHVKPDDWFFPGHFKNDPCMPGTLMFEGTIQTMSFFMAACGWTIDRDGWVFEPVQEIPYLLLCRGQVSTDSKELIYEVFVREVHDGPEPKLFADLLCTVDGLPAFHCARMGLQLTPDWPMDRLAEFPLPGAEKKGAMVNGFEMGIDSLIACAWGKPTRAFGPMYEPFDSHRTVARLPGPPYDFMSRVIDVDETAQNAMRSGVELTVEYDVPRDAWYFRENGAAVMPYAVLLEAALQPCGWLASYVGCALTRDDVDLCFRNLDGTNTQFLEVTPETGTLRTKSKLKNIARAGGNIIVSFDVEMRTADTDELVLTMDTVFGFFPPDALAEQVGLPITNEEKEKLEQPSNMDIQLVRQRPAGSPYFVDNTARLAETMLLMIDEVDFFEDNGGAHGLGRARAQKHIDPREWFFKAHFFTDPVQPGSLGLEALLQLLQFAMIEKGLGTENSRFEALAIDKPMGWKYRGQVLTHNKKVTSTIDITEIGEDDRGTYAIAEGSLWVDGMRIYHSPDIAMRIVGADEPAGSRRSQDAFGFVELDPAKDTWLNDHCPTYTLPALPAMSIVDLMAARAEEVSGESVVEISDVTIEKWVIFNGAQTLRVNAEKVGDGVYETTLEIWWEAPRKEMSRYDRVAKGTVRVGPSRAGEARTTRGWTGENTGEDPYESGELFHGPAFQILTALERDKTSARGYLSSEKNGVPTGTIHPGLLDAALQVIPHDHIEQWWADSPEDVIAYPFTVESLKFFGSLPDGDLVSEATFVKGDDRFVTFEISVFEGSDLWAQMTLTEILMPKGPIGKLTGEERRAFIRDREYVPGARLSSPDGTLDKETVKASNWFKGTVESIYDVRGFVDTVVPEIVVKDAAAERFKMHPSRFDVVSGKARPKGAPIVLIGDERTEIDLQKIKLWWRDQLGVPVGWLGDDLYGSMIDRFVKDVTFENLGALDRIHGRSVLFLGNHEVQIESIIITMLASVLSDTTVVTMANAKHERGWVGGLIRDMFSYPGCTDPKNIVYFDQSNPASMLDLIEGFKRDVAERGASVMVHAPGTRAIRAGEGVERVSSALLDMALELNLPIVPIFFDGGLPVEPLRAKKLEFPIGQTGQTYRFGTPILPEVLGAFEYKDRRAVVMDAINRLGTNTEPNPPSARHIREIAKLRSEGWDEINAVLFNLLKHVDAPDRDASRLIELFGTDEEPAGDRDQWLHRFVTRRFRF